jgi:L-iditol 2-dehydrogenase
MSMTDEMTCAVRTGPYRIEIQTRPIPRPKPYEVLVQMCEVGICGGDLHQFKGETPGILPPGGVVTGHEGVGVVVGIGSDVQDMNIGQRVVLGGSRADRACGVCEWCRTGLMNLCPKTSWLDGKAVFNDGDCAQYMTYPTTAITRLPDSLSWDEAANAHGLAACIYALDKPNHKIGESVVIFGVGCAGLYFGQLEANCQGASQVIMVGRSKNRLEAAAALGFETINSREESPIERIEELTGGAGADLVIDTTSVSDVMAMTVKVAKKRGSVLIYAPGETTMNMRYVLKKELAVLGSTGAAPNEIAIRVIEQGLVKADDIITHHFPLEQTQDAYELAISDDKSSAGYVKGAIVCSSELLEST